MVWREATRQAGGSWGLTPPTDSTRSDQASRLVMPRSLQEGRGRVNRQMGGWKAAGGVFEAARESADGQKGEQSSKWPKDSQSQQNIAASSRSTQGHYQAVGFPGGRVLLLRLKIFRLLREVNPDPHLGFRARRGGSCSPGTAEPSCGHPWTETLAQERNRLLHFPAERQHSGERQRPRLETFQCMSCLGVRERAAMAVGAPVWPWRPDKTEGVHGACDTALSWEGPEVSGPEVDSVCHGGIVCLSVSPPKSHPCS